MDKNFDSKFLLQYTLSGIIALILAIAPILDPYVFIHFGSSEVMLMDILILFCVVVMVLRRKTKLPIVSRQLLLLLIFLSFLTLISFMGANHDRSLGLAFKNIIIWCSYVVLVGVTWNGVDRNRFIFYVNTIVLCAIVLIIVQFLAGNFGVSFWDGKLPGLQLGKYDGWAGFVDKNTGDIRPNGFYQEPSYFSLYSLPLLMYLVSKKKYINAILLTTVFLITTSIVGILGSVFVWAIAFIDNLKKKGSFVKSLITLISIIVVMGIVITILYSKVEFIHTSFDYVLKRLTNFNTDLSGSRMSSTKYRIYGQIAFFDSYSFFYKLVGAGAAQFAQFFGLTNSYSNIWVTTILDYGIIGVVSLCIFLITIIYKSHDRNVWKYVIIIAIVFACDRVWFNWYFFYLFTWIFIFCNSRN